MAVANPGIQVELVSESSYVRGALHVLSASAFVTDDPAELQAFVSWGRFTLYAMDELGNEVTLAPWIRDLGDESDNYWDNYPVAEIVSGGDGFDSVYSSGSRADYTVTERDGVIEFSSIYSPEVDILTSIELLGFVDGTYNLAIRDIVGAADGDVVNSIIELYVAYLNRVPEADGLGYWIKQYQDGMSFDAISAYFYEAGKTFTEVTGYGPDTPLADFIRIIYENVLYRRGDTAPTQQEIDWWVDEVSSGREDIPGLIQRMISDSKAFADHPVYGAMSDYFENKIEVGRLHAITFGIGYDGSLYTPIEETLEKACQSARNIDPLSASNIAPLIAMMS